MTSSASLWCPGPVWRRFSCPPGFAPARLRRQRVSSRTRRNEETADHDRIYPRTIEGQGSLIRSTRIGHRGHGRCDRIAFHAHDLWALAGQRRTGQSPCPVRSRPRCTRRVRSADAGWTSRRCLRVGGSDRCDESRPDGAVHRFRYGGAAQCCRARGRQRRRHRIGQVASRTRPWLHAVKSQGQERLNHWPQTSLYRSGRSGRFGLLVPIGLHRLATVGGGLGVGACIAAGVSTGAGVAVVLVAVVSVLAVVAV